MGLAPFFDRIYGAVGGHLGVSKETLASALNSLSVGVRCEGSLSQNDLWISELTVNILARLYPTLRISAPDKLAQQLRDLAHAINPRIEFKGESPPETTIAIGPRTQAATLHPSASGWVARVLHSSQKQPTSELENPYASGAAAALACAELFRRIFLKAPAERDYNLSLLTFEGNDGHDMSLPVTDLGESLYVGVGAVGNAGLWALARDQYLSGKLWLVDNDRLTLLNLQRYVLGTNGDVSTSKVQLARKLLKHTKLKVAPCNNSLEALAQGRKGLHFPTFCISVDNVETRRAAQALLPELIVNGWTGERSLGVSWHIFSREAACLACLYQPKGEGPSAVDQAARALGLNKDRTALLWVTRSPLAEEDLALVAKTLGVSEGELRPWRNKPIGDLYTDLVCGVAPIDVAGTGRVETVPLAHQSVLTGVLMATELIKRLQREPSLPMQAETLVMWDDILRPPPTDWRRPRPREAGCICGDQDYQRIYERKWRNPRS